MHLVASVARILGGMVVDPSPTSPRTSSGCADTERTFDGFGVSRIVGFEGAGSQSVWFDIFSNGGITASFNNKPNALLAYSSSMHRKITSQKKK